MFLSVTKSYLFVFYLHRKNRPFPYPSVVGFIRVPVGPQIQYEFTIYIHMLHTRPLQNISYIGFLNCLQI